MIRESLTRVSRIVSWPATLAHELTHLLVSLPWADRAAIVVDERGPAHVAAWPDDAPWWAPVLASLAPTLLGAAVGIWGLWLLVTAPPSSAREWLLSAAIAGYWTIYVAPSDEDLDLHDPQEETTHARE